MFIVSASQWTHLPPGRPGSSGRSKSPAVPQGRKGGRGERGSLPSPRPLGPTRAPRKYSEPVVSPCFHRPFVISSFSSQLSLSSFFVFWLFFPSFILCCLRLPILPWCFVMLPTDTVQLLSMKLYSICWTWIDLDFYLLILRTRDSWRLQPQTHGATLHNTGSAPIIWEKKAPSY